MKVVVDGGASTVAIDDVEDLNGLSVVLIDVSPERATHLMGELGRIDGEHAWLRIKALNAEAPTPRSCSWEARFAEAMSYAQTKGWTDSTGTFVRAHIEATKARV